MFKNILRPLTLRSLTRDEDKRGDWIYSVSLIILRSTESLILAQDERWRRA